jgi:parallel beta-helix repeat protein
MLRNKVAVSKREIVYPNEDCYRKEEQMNPEKAAIPKVLHMYLIIFLALLFLCPSPAPAATEVGGTIDSDTLWDDTTQPYVVTGNGITINNNATLTIEPGVEVVLGSGDKITVGHLTTGKLVANGTASEPITFTGDSANPWYYIDFTKWTGAGSSLSHCVIENGGLNYYLVRIATSNVSIENCTLQNSDKYGIYLTDNSGAATLANNTYRENASYPIYVHRTLSVSAVDDTSTFVNNGDNRIFYMGGTIDADTTIAKAGIPYYVHLFVHITNDATLTIDPGAELQFSYHLGGLQVGWGGQTPGTGKLEAIGTVADPIIFTSSNANPAPGDWRGIYITIFDDGSTIENAVVEYGGSIGQTGYGNIGIADASPTIKSCIVQHSLTYGLRILESNAAPATTPDISCNIITANDGGIQVYHGAAPTIHQNNITGNTAYGLEVKFYGITVDATNNYWGASNGPGGDGPGSGDVVTDDDGGADLVLFDPWLTAPASCVLPVTARINADSIKGCESLTVAFTDKSTGGVESRQWDFGDGSTSSERNPTHQYTATGIYTVTLKVVRGADSDTTTMEIIVTESIPTASFSGGPKLTSQAPLTVDFTDASTSCGTDAIVSWSWDFDGDGIEDSSEKNPSYTFSVAGDYTVSLKVEDEDGDADTVERVKYVHVSEEEPVKAFVTRFYELCLSRSPDAAGLNGWVASLLDGKQTGSDVAYGFVFSQEFINQNTSNEDYLKILYEAFFNRPADSAGLQGWLDAIQKGATREDVLNGFIYAVEFAELCDAYGIKAYEGHVTKTQREAVEAFVTRFYQLCLDRDPDAAGLKGWADNLLGQVQTGADVAQGFIYSPEFIAKNTSNSEYLLILYQAFFNRDADQAGWDLWLSELNSGRDRWEVLDGFIYSTEFSNLCSEYGIQAF